MSVVLRAIIRAKSCERGSAAVEFAFIGMLLIAGSVVVVDFGRAFWLYHKLANAVEMTSRKNLVHPISDAQISIEIRQGFPTSEANSIWARAPQVSVETGPNFRTVKSIIAFKPIIPFFMGENIDLTLTRRFWKVPGAT